MLPVTRRKIDHGNKLAGMLLSLSQRFGTSLISRLGQFCRNPMEAIIVPPT
jgi:hypothetical protein